MRWMGYSAVPTTLTLPDYAGGSIVNLMASIAVALGAKHWPYAPLRLLAPAALRQRSSILLVVVDGLGYRYLARGPVGQPAAPASARQPHLRLSVHHGDSDHRMHDGLAPAAARPDRLAHVFRGDRRGRRGAALPPAAQRPGLAAARPRARVACSPTRAFSTAAGARASSSRPHPSSNSEFNAGAQRARTAPRLRIAGAVLPHHRADPAHCAASASSSTPTGPSWTPSPTSMASARAAAPSPVAASTQGFARLLRVLPASTHRPRHRRPRLHRCAGQPSGSSSTTTPSWPPCSRSHCAASAGPPTAMCAPDRRDAFEDYARSELAERALLFDSRALIQAAGSAPASRTQAAVADRRLRAADAAARDHQGLDAGREASYR